MKDLWIAMVELDSSNVFLAVNSAGSLSNVDLFTLDISNLLYNNDGVTCRFIPIFGNKTESTHLLNCVCLMT